MAEVPLGPTSAPAADEALASRHDRRLTLAPGALELISMVPSSSSSPAPLGSHFEVLVEDVSDTSSEGSWDLDVPFASAMEVVGSPTAPRWSTLICRGRRTDEELAADFWSDIGYPTPESRV
jgi:hypothetical protein